MAKKVRAGVIGLGMGRYHVRNFLDCPDCELLAICDADKERLEAARAEYGVPHALTDWRKMLEMDELDCVAVVLPNTLHKPVTLAAFDAGKHVLCEKPLAMNAQEAETMVKAGHKAGRSLMVHFNQRFTPDAMWLKRTVESGALGDIYYAKTGWIRRRGIPALGSWFTNMAQSGGGALIDIGVHALDLALWLMGSPKMAQTVGTAYAMFGPEGGRKARKTFDVDDLAAAIVKFENGATLMLEASWASNIEEEVVYTELMGTKAGAKRARGQVTLFGEQAGAATNSRPAQYLEGCENPQAHFVRCIQKGVEPIATGEQGLEVMRILDAIYESTGGRTNLVTQVAKPAKARKSAGR